MNYHQLVQQAYQTREPVAPPYSVEGLAGVLWRATMKATVSTPLPLATPQLEDNKLTQQLQADIRVFNELTIQKLEQYQHFLEAVAKEDAQ